MTDPFVVCVMLTRGERPAMMTAAVESWRRQTYRNRRLLIWDTGGENGGLNSISDSICYFHVGGGGSKTVGALRNDANDIAHWLSADIIAHWDDDDWSHEERLAEQVALLRLSGRQCVGYNSVPFWDQRCPRGGKGEASPKDRDTADHASPGSDGESWLYANADGRFVVGASMCYWTWAWQSDPFDAAPRRPDPRGSGEDYRWWVKHAAACLGVAARPWVLGSKGMYQQAARMVCRIHSGNTSKAYARDLMAAYNREWLRAPELDVYCRAAMSFEKEQSCSAL